MNNGTGSARRILLTCILGTVPGLAGCADSEASRRGDGAQTLTGEAAPGADAGSGLTCLPAEEVSDVVGFPVSVLPSGTFQSAGHVVCGYVATATGLGAFVSLASGPAVDVEGQMAEVRSSAKAMQGEDREATAIAIGEGGFAYGSSSRSEAIALARDRLYHVDLTTTSMADLGGKRDAMVELLRRIVP